MGGNATIIFFAPDQYRATLAAMDTFEEIERLENILTDYRYDSEAMKLMQRDPNVWHDASPELVEILALSREVWSISNGAFDPTIGPLTKLWRPLYFPISPHAAAKTPPEPPTAEELAAARARVGMDLIELDTENNRIRFATPGMSLDFGGIGKGFAAEKALALLRDLGYPSALVDMGGDIALGDPPPELEGWTITIDTGLDEPRDILLANAGIATSGDQFRFAEIAGVRYSHIIDPRTGMGLTRRVAVTVIDPEPWRADALASAASILGDELLSDTTTAYPETQIFIQYAD